jgi:ribosome-binding factor A
MAQPRKLTMAKRQRDRQRSEGETPGRSVSQRRRRVAEELRHTVAQILRDGDYRDPVLRDASITVAEVRISPDLRNATVYVMPLAGGKVAEILSALKRSAPFLRGLVARDLALRYVPSLVFALDETFDQADRISALLALPEVERDLHPPQPARDETGDDAG